MTVFSGTLPFPNALNESSAPYLALAPMEGLMDSHLREIITDVGGIDHCVTEFIRVIDSLYPARVFYRLCPELQQGGKTRSGTPVHIQLLGSNPEFMAANAAFAAELGAPAIDINFGCPARTVNRNKGGAILLQEPDALYEIAQAVRAAVPPHIPVSAKVRLGYADKSQALDIAHAIEASGVQWLTVHARTKTEGYRPPAYWEYIAKIRQHIRIPVIANGEIWTVEHAQQCQQQSQSNLLMIGRGLVSMPDLAAQIKSRTQSTTPPHIPFTWQQHLALFLLMVPKLEHLSEKSLTDRLKQWLFYFTRHFPDIADLFEQVKRVRDKEEFLEIVRTRLKSL